MIRNLNKGPQAPKAPRATVEQTHALGQILVDLNYEPTNVIEWLKSVSYIYEGIHYEATYVANFVAGYRACQRVQASVPTAPVAPVKRTRATKAK